MKPRRLGEGYGKADSGVEGDWDEATVTTISCNFGLGGGDTHSSSDRIGEDGSAVIVRAPDAANL